MLLVSRDILFAGRNPGRNGCHVAALGSIAKGAHVSVAFVLDIRSIPAGGQGKNQTFSIVFVKIEAQGFSLAAPFGNSTEEHEQVSDRRKPASLVVATGPKRLLTHTEAYVSFKSVKLHLFRLF